ncbi:MAG: hypothetical protein ACXVPN_16805 [Bacteroidia bacterium]
MKSDEISSTKSQEILTLSKDIKGQIGEMQSIHYQELEELFKQGFYVESFNQTVVGTERLIITFILRKFNATTY